MAKQRLNDQQFLTPMQKAGGEELPVNIPPMAPQRIPVAPPSPETVFNSRGTAWASNRYGTSDPQHMSDLYNAEKMYRRLGPEGVQGITAAMNLRAPKPEAAPSNPWGVNPSAIQSEYESAYEKLGEEFDNTNNDYRKLIMMKQWLSKLGENLMPSLDGSRQPDMDQIRRFEDAREFLQAEERRLRREKEGFIRNNPHFRSLEPYAPMPTPYTPGLYGDENEKLPPVPDLFRGFYGIPQNQEQPQQPAHRSPQPPPPNAFFDAF